MKRNEALCHSLSNSTTLSLHLPTALTAVGDLLTHVRTHSNVYSCVDVPGKDAIYLYAFLKGIEARKKSRGSV